MIMILFAINDNNTGHLDKHVVTNTNQSESPVFRTVDPL